MMMRLLTNILSVMKQEIVEGYDVKDNGYDIVNLVQKNIHNIKEQH